MERPSDRDDGPGDVPADRADLIAEILADPNSWIDAPIDLNGGAGMEAWPEGVGRLRERLRAIRSREAGGRD